jgi:hypothetical protein
LVDGSLEWVDAEQGVEGFGSFVIDGEDEEVGAARFYWWWLLL